MGTLSLRECVADEIAYELALWPIPPKSIAYVGDEEILPLLRKLFYYPKLTLICSATAARENILPFWANADWGESHDVLFCLNLFTEHCPSRSPRFFEKARACLETGGRIIAVESLRTGSVEHRELLAASRTAGSTLISLLPMYSDDRWSCYVFQWPNANSV